VKFRPVLGVVRADHGEPPAELFRVVDKGDGTNQLFSALAPKTMCSHSPCVSERARWPTLVVAMMTTRFVSAE